VPPQDYRSLQETLEGFSASRGATRPSPPSPTRNLTPPLVQGLEPQRPPPVQSLESSEPKEGSLGTAFRWLRKPQQLLAVGPALALARGGEGGLWSSAQEALERDLSFRDVVKESGLTGRTAWAAGTLGDLVLDPLNLLPIGAIGKGLRYAGQALRVPQASRALKIPQAAQALKATEPVQTLGRLLVTDFGKNIAPLPGTAVKGKPDTYLGLRRAAQLKEGREVSKALDLGNEIAKLPAKEQRLITQFMVAGLRDVPNMPASWTLKRQQDYIQSFSKPRAEIDALRESLIKQASPEHQGAVRRLANLARDRDILQGKEAVRVKLLKKETVAKRAGSHQRRFFTALEKNPNLAPDIRSHEVPFLQRSLEFLGMRKKLTPEQLRKYGLIEEAAYPVAKGQAELSQAITRQEFLNDVATQYALDPLKVKKGTPEMLRGYKKLRNDPALGPLEGRYVPTALHYELSRKGVAGGPVSDAYKKWRKGVGWWKFKSVVLNPATHGKNIIGDFALADMAGLSPMRGPRKYAQAAMSLSKKDEYYQLAKDHGVYLQGHSSMIGADLPLIMDGVAKSGKATFDQLDNATTSWFEKSLTNAAGALKKGGEKASDLYQLEEQWFKHAFFIDQMEKSVAKAGVPLSKMNPLAKKNIAEAATEAAETAIFDYSRVPELVDRMRRSGLVPFVTFPYKAMAATGRALWRNPSSLTRQGNIVRMFEPSIEEQRVERTGIPEWMEQGTWARLPREALPHLLHEESIQPDTKGYVPLDYILPSADPSELVDTLRTGTVGGLLGTPGRPLSFLSSPLWEMATTAKTGIDPFTQREVSASPGGWGRYAWDFVAPPPIGRGARRMTAAMREEPINPLSGLSKTQTRKGAFLASALGVGQIGVDTNTSRNLRLRGIRSELREKQRDQRYLLSQAKNKNHPSVVSRYNHLQGQIDKLYDEFKRLGQGAQGETRSLETETLDAPSQESLPTPTPRSNLQKTLDAFIR
jgi:hypothetical protein